MKTLVTGGAGFIGSTLVDRLLGEGHEVVALDNLASGKLANLTNAQKSNGFRFVEHDIRDESVVQLVADQGVEVVFHLAAQMDVRVSVTDPAYDASVNVMGAINVVEGARRSGVRKVVFASSGGTIYGAASESLLPFDENVPQHPLSPYGITKKVFGDYLFAYKALHGLDYCALALGNIFGPRQDPHGEAGVVAIFGQRLLSGEQCKIFGDGSATRDYCYVDDTVDAFYRAATSGTGLYNIGTGIETSTKELYFAMAKAAGVDQEPEFAPARPGELERSCLNQRESSSRAWLEPQG